MRYALVSDVLLVGSINGRVALQVPKDKGPGSTPGIFLSTLPSGDLSGNRVGGWVDVRDVALQHILALSNPEAGGERIISTARKHFDQFRYAYRFIDHVAVGQIRSLGTTSTMC